MDANQGYGHGKNASRVVRQLTDAGVSLVEQPSQGLRYMSEVTASSSVPIVADESCWDIHDAYDVVRERAADCFSIYLAKAGGFGGACKVADFAESHLMACDVNGSIESAIGTAANVHFALARPSVSWRRSLRSARHRAPIPIVWPAIIMTTMFWRSHGC